MQRSPSCATTWVDRACAATNIRLADRERRRLIAALLSRQHLILSGPAGIGKRRLAYALALSIVDGQESHMSLLQGHPWWASKTNDVAYFVNLQTRFSEWRLAYFMESVLPSQQPPSQVQAENGTGDYGVCVERMSPVEIDFYFRAVSYWLLKSAQSKADRVSIRLIGTYDSSIPPDLDDQIQRVAALVHLSGVPVENPI
jgi:DNA polymerase III delta prime subunit